MTDHLTLRRPSDAAVNQLRAAACTLADDLGDQHGDSQVEHETASDSFYEALYQAALECETQTRRASEEDRRMEQRVGYAMSRGLL